MVGVSRLSWLRRGGVMDVLDWFEFQLVAARVAFASVTAEWMRAWEQAVTR
jgi:hypothetical protein